MMRQEQMAREFGLLMTALFCRNTLCISRKSDEVRAQIFRETPQTIDSAFTKGPSRRAGRQAQAGGLPVWRPERAAGSDS